MADQRRRLQEAVADAIAAGDSVDWRKVDRAAAKSGDVDLMSQLQIVSAIRASRHVDTPRPASRWARTVEAAVAVVLTIAVAQLLLAIVGTPAALARVPWLYIANVVSFGVGGLVLLAGGGRDRRLPLLGGLFLTISSAFAVSLMPQPGVSFGGTLTALLRPLQPEAFVMATAGGQVAMSSIAKRVRKGFIETVRAILRNRGLAVSERLAERFTVRFRRRGVGCRFSGGRRPGTRPRVSRLPPRPHHARGHRGPREPHRVLGRGDRDGLGGVRAEHRSTTRARARCSAGS